MVIADFLKMSQKPMSKRLAISIPIFAVAFGLSLIDFNFLWRYFSWANQTTAMILLWAAAVYLVREKRNHWIATIPAIFMTAVSFTYLLQAPEGFGLPTSISYPVGLLITVGITALFANKVRKERKIAAAAAVPVSAK